MQSTDFAGVYQEIAEILDVESAIKLYEHFRGQQVVFPQKLYNQNYVYTYVKKNYDGSNMRELCQMFNYSDRRIRQILNKNL